MGFSKTQRETFICQVWFLRYPVEKQTDRQTDASENASETTLTTAIGVAN